jgi:apolipoprotein D and lipocalin family protein
MRQSADAPSRLCNALNLPFLREMSRIMRRTHMALLLAALASFSLGCTSVKAPLKTVQSVDLQRYMGDWYVIANIPYVAEKNCFDSIESYALRPDGNIDNWFTCRKKSFDAPLERKASALATVTDKTSNAVWKVKFFKILSVKYLILDLDPNYQWVAVGHPSRRYGWIMARTKTLDDSTYRGILRRLADQGYDPAKFEKVPQRLSSTSGGQTSGGQIRAVER